MRQKIWTSAETGHERALSVATAISRTAAEIRDEKDGCFRGGEQEPLSPSSACFEPDRETGPAPNPGRPSEDAMFPLSNDGIVTLSIKGEILQANETFLTQLGYSREALLGRQASALCPNSEIEAWKDAWRAMRAQGSCLVETSLQRKDGTEMAAEVSAALMDLGDREIAQIIVRDISLREKIEENLRQTEKTAALGMLAGGIAHDLNNIFTSVASFAFLGESSLPAGAEARSYLQRIAEANEQAAALVQQVLAFIRPHAGETVPVEMSAIVKDVLALLRAGLPPNVTLREMIDEQPNSVVINPAEIYQLVMNLCTNASQAMEPSGGNLEVVLQRAEESYPKSRRRRGSKEAAFVRLTIRDDGPGIDPAIRDQVFNPLFTTKKSGEGTGLGLSIVRGIATRCGGHVDVESEPGVGTAFHVYFPLAGAVSSGANRETHASVPRGSGHILFVDDEESLLLAGRDVLQRLGYRVTARLGGEQALETLGAAPQDYDLVISDVTMPGMNGVEFAVRVREIRPGIPIVFTSGYSDPISPAEAKQLGISEILTKPYRIRDLGAAIRRTVAVRSR